MSGPLNPILYRALIRKFKEVSIAHPGTRYVAKPTRSKYRRGAMESPPAVPGEYYCVDCPFCRDTRKRLWINHFFNVAGADGDDHLYLACCHNERCVRNRTIQVQLRNMIYPFGYGACQRLEEIRSAAEISNASAILSSEHVRLPVELPVSAPWNHRAIEYLIRRNFDPQEILEQWSVYYCHDSPNSAPRISDRLIIPIYDLHTDLSTQHKEAFLVGWQAREITTSPVSHAKYLTMSGMRKSQILYGLPQAVNTTGPLVVVEGVTDVWRLGFNAVAVLGKSISPQQRGLLISHFRGRPIVIVFDRDASDAARSNAAALQQSRREVSDFSAVLTAHPPVGSDDVGDASREAAWEAIEHAVRAARATLASAETPTTAAPLTLRCTREISETPQEGVNARFPGQPVSNQSSNDDARGWEITL